MKIIFAASEIAPYAKTGGLADVAGSLPLAIARLGHDVRLVMPRYGRIDPKAFGLAHIASFYVPLGTWKERCDVFEGKTDRVTVYFINKDVYFGRPELYRTAQADYPDNAERFIFFSRSILELCIALGLEPHIIHVNDWQTGLVPLYLQKAYRAAPNFRHTKTVLTIHNLGYQGIFWHWDLRLIGLGWGIFNPEGIEFWGKLNFLKAGIVYADAVTTVSKTYSREIQTPEYGHGLEGVIAKRARDLYGIVNGIDYSEWDPSTDRLIAKQFSAAKPDGKAVCKQALQMRVGLPASDMPLAAMVTRLTEQKGLDILIEALPELMGLGIRLVILGTGEERYHVLLKSLEEKYRDRMKVILEFDDGLARQIYAGADIFLMPSLYEPCGLGQMIALRYGTVPVARRTGGLADTIIDYNPKTGKGTGFLFDKYSAADLVSCIRRCLSVYSDRRKWRSLVRAEMVQDFSWERSAKEYVKVYRKVMGQR